MTSSNLPRPIPNSYWAIEQVLACEYLLDLDKEKAQAKLTALLEAGRISSI